MFKKVKLKRENKYTGGQPNQIQQNRQRCDKKRSDKQHIQTQQKASSVASNNHPNKN